VQIRSIWSDALAGAGEFGARPAGAGRGNFVVSPGAPLLGQSSRRLDEKRPIFRGDFAPPPPAGAERKGILATAAEPVMHVELFIDVLEVRADRGGAMPSASAYPLWR